MKQISFMDDGREYTLTFTRDSVAKLEQRYDFKLEDMDAKPVSTMPLMFHGAFLAKHPYIKKEKTDAIFAKFTNKQALFDKLAEMYGDAMNTLIDEPEENEGNVTWEANW